MRKGLGGVEFQQLNDFPHAKGKIIAGQKVQQDFKTSIAEGFDGDDEVIPQNRAPSKGSKNGGNSMRWPEPQFLADIVLYLFFQSLGKVDVDCAFIFGDLVFRY